MDTSTVLIIVVVAVVLIGGGLALVARRGRAGAVSETGPKPLGRTASALGSALRAAWGRGLSEESWERVEEALIAADVGLETSQEIVAVIKQAGPETVEDAKSELTLQLTRKLDGKDRLLHLSGEPAVLLVVGVNGTGKTTTIAKLARRLTNDGHTVLLAAADTFRAAAGEQLKAWSDRLGVEIVAGQQGGDPASVAFDALGSARAKGTDVVIVDTAGRLHGKKNLMDELSKIHRVASGERGEVDEVLLVLDATGGQNGLAQVMAFADAVPVSGIVLTKLDGTAKGGIVFSVEKRVGVPVKFIGLGEGLDDLQPFEPNRFVAEVLEQT